MNHMRATLVATVALAIGGMGLQAVHAQVGATLASPVPDA